MVHLCHCDSLAELQEALPEMAPSEVSQLNRMEGAVHQLLVGVGEDPSREGLIDTPRRVAKAWLDMTRGYRQECKSAFGTALFHEPIVSAGSDGLVIVRDITFAALSEQTLLPFHGRCHIAYVPRHGVVLGLSKLARVTKCLAARLQTQQAFTERLIAAVQSEVQAKGVAAVVQANHLGTGAAPASQLCSAATGCFTDSASGHLQEFVTLLRLCNRAAPAPAMFGEPLVTAAEAEAAAGAAPVAGGGADAQPPAAASSSMVAAADALLMSVGEDPTRKGLKGGAARYIRWLQGATAGYRMQLPGPAAGAAAAELGPPTPDDHSPDPSDASSDDMSADGPCYVSLREARDAAGAEPAAAAAAAADAACGCSHGASSRGRLGLDGLQTFSTHFSSQCEHHLLPFYGRLKLAYLPASGSSDGATSAAATCCRSQLAHIVEMFSKRLQVQERLTHQVADAVAASLGARAVLVVVQSAHMCMVARGVEKHASTTLTTAARGTWADDAEARGAALEALLEALQQQQQPPSHQQR